MNLSVGHDSGMQKLKVPAVILTFDLGIWFLHVTHPTMHDEVMGRTWIWNAQTLSASCDLDLWPRDMFLHAIHRLVVMIISAKYFLNPTMNDEVMSQTGLWNAQTLSADSDFDLWPCDLVLTPDTPSCSDDHFCQIIFESHHAWWSYGLDKNLECTNFKCQLWPWPLT